MLHNPFSSSSSSPHPYFNSNIIGCILKMTHLLAINEAVEIFLMPLLSLQFECSFKHSFHHLTLTLGEECRLRLFVNSVLRIFRPKRDEVTGEWRILHNRSLIIHTPHQILFR
jgi:hypothetical protein